MRSADQEAIRNLLKGDHAANKRLAVAVSKALSHHTGQVCPECGGTDIADNGGGPGVGFELEFKCLAEDCDGWWSAEDYAEVSY